MKTEKPTQRPERKRHGRRANGKTQTSISLSEEALDKARAAAEADGRSLSNFLERLIVTAPKSKLEGPSIHNHPNILHR